VGGVISATVLAVIFVPLFFVLVLKLFPATRAKEAPPRDEAPVALQESGAHRS
jgi:hypothetical protein